MLYYKVPANMDNVQIYQNGLYKGFLIGNELLTAADCKRLAISCKMQEKLQPVQIKKTNTYWFFGTRFEI